MTSESRQWAIAEGCIPRDSSFETRTDVARGKRHPQPGDQDWYRDHVVFHDREPVGPIAGRRPRLTDDLASDIDDPDGAAGHAVFIWPIESDVPIVVQHSRLDSRKAEVSLLSTVAYSQG